MIMGFGIHSSKTVENVVLTHPDYVKWMLDNIEKASYQKRFVNGAKKQVNRLINIFDKKPTMCKCNTIGCNNTAENAIFFSSVVSNHKWLCNECLGGKHSTLGRYKIVRTYRNALSYVEKNCKNAGSNYELIIKYLAEAKGLPSRFTETDESSFFNLEVSEQ